MLKFAPVPRILHYTQSVSLCSIFSALSLHSHLTLSSDRPPSPCSRLRPSAFTALAHRSSGCCSRPLLRAAKPDQLCSASAQPSPPSLLRGGRCFCSMLHVASSPSFCLAYPRNLHCPHYSPKRSVKTRFAIRCSALETRNGAKVEYTPWLVVGLGNPGNKYHGTRHNVGFEIIDSLSQAEGIMMNTIQSKALIGIGSIGEVPVLLAKPQTYMNFSGESVGPLAAYYRVPVRHILLVYDETSLPNGVLRLQPKGGHGHHNGLKNVIGHLDGSRDFPRLAVGIGNPPGAMDLRAFLLQKFSSEERKQIDESLEQGVQAVRTLVLNGFSPHVNRFNLGQKYKYHKV